MTMNFRDAKAKARVVNLNIKENYSVVKLRTARHDESNDKWINSSFFTMFVGNAHKKINELKKEIDLLECFENGDVRGGVPIFLKSVGISNESFQKDGKTVFPKNYKITVFAWEFQDELKNQANLDNPPSIEVSEENEEDELPF
jgi:hypothetical protein